VADWICRGIGIDSAEGCALGFRRGNLPGTDSGTRRRHLSRESPQRLGRSYSRKFNPLSPSGWTRRSVPGSLMSSRAQWRKFTAISMRRLVVGAPN